MDHHSGTIRDTSQARCCRRRHNLSLGNTQRSILSDLQNQDLRAADRASHPPASIPVTAAGQTHNLIQEDPWSCKATNSHHHHSMHGSHTKYRSTKVTNRRYTRLIPRTSPLQWSLLFSVVMLANSRQLSKTLSIWLKSTPLHTSIHRALSRTRRCHRQSKTD